MAGSTVVVTGAGRGLGLGMARRFGQAGARAVIAEINDQTGAEAAAALKSEGIDALFERLDVRDPAQSTALVDSLVRRFGQVDVWVNNAGIAYANPAEKLTLTEWNDSIAIMLSGAFYCAQAVGRHMLDKGHGVIVNVASIHAYHPIEGRAAYSVAKAGLVALTQSLGIEWAKRGVRVVGIAPGVVMTDLVKKAIADGFTNQATLERRTPLRRLATVEEIAESVFYLASDEASYVVGETMQVDGGWGAYQLF